MGLSKASSAVHLVMCLAACHVCVYTQSIDGELHLEGGSGASSGCIKIYVSGSWKILCTRDWTRNNSQVVCRSLGYSGGSSEINNVQAMETTYPTQFDCKGTENALELCPIFYGLNVGCAPIYVMCDESLVSEGSNNADFIMSTMVGALIFIVIVVSLASLYVITHRKRLSRRRLPETGGSHGGSTRRNHQPRNQNIFSISNSDLPPPYVHLEEDIPPPYFSIPQPSIVIPIVGREERYTRSSPRCTEPDAMEYFQELDAEQLRVQSADLEVMTHSMDNVAESSSGTHTMCEELDGYGLERVASSTSILLDDRRHIQCEVGPSNARTESAVILNTSSPHNFKHVNDVHIPDNSIVNQ